MASKQSLVQVPHLPSILVLKLLFFLFPSTFGSGILQLLQSRTSRKFLACRLTPDMETKLLFMTSRVSSPTAAGDVVDTSEAPSSACRSVTDWWEVVKWMPLIYLALGMGHIAE